jgi:AraC-like DNA-binding protein
MSKKPKAPKRKGGMPAFTLDQHKLKELMRLKPSLSDTAAIFDCSNRTIERYIDKHFEMTFTEFRERHMVHSRHRLIRMAMERAETSDTLLIFCLKALCGWSDRQEHSTLVQVKTETHVNTEADQKMVQELKDVVVGYLGERKESA